MAPVAAVGGAGAIWGLGLARFLAEAVLWSPSYRSWWVAGAFALSCSLGVLALGRLSPLGSGSPVVDPRWSCAIPLGLPAFYVSGVFSHPLAGGTLLAGGAVLALLVVWRDPPGWLLAALLVLTVLVLYLRTLLPSIGEADTLEFQVVAAKLGVAHPTGYPLYVLLTKLFTLLPLKNVAWRVNLASAVFASGAVLALYAILHRLTNRLILSWLTALGFAFSITFWSQAVIAEVYTLHNLFVVAVFWLLLQPRREGQGAEARQARQWQLTLLLLGLSLTNHLTTILMVPAIVLALLWDRPRMKPRDWAVGGGLFLLGLSIYLFIPLRWPALNDGRWMTVRDFLAYVSGGRFQGALRLDGWRDPTRWRIVARLLHEPFGWPGLVLGGLGVVELGGFRVVSSGLSSFHLGTGSDDPARAESSLLYRAIRRRRALALTGITFAAYVVYGLSYHVADIAVFLLPAHLILAIWIGIGAAFLARLLDSVVPTLSGAWQPTLVALFALLPLSRIWINLPVVDRSDDRGSHTWGQYVLDQPLDVDSAVLADTKKFAPLYYLQQVEGVRPDLDIVLLGTETLYQADLRRRMGEGQTVYLARYLPGLGEFYLRSVGPLAEVRNEPPSPGAEPDEVVARFGEGIELVGADVERDPQGRDLRHVTLTWRADSSVSHDLVVRLRLTSQDGRVAWRSDGARPVDGLYPTNAWAVKAPISDYHDVPIPPWLPPGTYGLEVALFRPFGDEGVMVDGDSTAWFPLETVTVETPRVVEPLPYRRRYSFGGGAWLTGFDSPGEIPVDSRLAMDLAWQDVEEDKRVRLSWVDGRGQPRGSAAVPLTAGMVRSRHGITTPREAGSYTLEVGLVDEPAACGWLAPSRDACPLVEVDVLAARGGLANFGDRTLLLDAEVEKDAVTPGELIPVRLRWRGLRPIGDDYTVFVHLVGPDGRLHGQVDSWPVQGSYPTSQWSPGRNVEDRYEVRLDADAPAGDYQVEVGWYLLETMERLQVLDEAGEPIADSFVVGRLVVRK